MDRPAWPPYALVILAACAVHLPALRFGFVFDDEHLVVNNAFLRQDWSPLTAFQHHFWHGTSFATSYYRPLVAASLALNGRLLGWGPPAFHLINILLHAANAALLLALARHLGARPVPATCAAVLFAVHPVSAWPVASVVARVDLWPALFILLAWRRAVPAAAGVGPPADGPSTLVASAPRWSAALWAGFFFLLALLSKESAVAFLVVPWLIWGRLSPADAGDRASSGAARAREMVSRLAGWRPGLATLATLAVYLGLKSAAGVRLLPGSQVIDPTTNPLGALPLPGRIWAALELCGRYLLYLVLPLRFTDPRDYVSGPLAGPASAGVLLSAGLLGAAALAVLFLCLRRSPLAGPLSFALLSFLPASNLLLPIGSLYAQNFLYLPLLGSSLAAGLALDRALGRAIPPTGDRPGWNRSALLIAGSAVLILALATVREAMIWRDALSLFSAWSRRFPNYALAHSRLGVARLAAGDAIGAEHPLRLALRLDARMVEAHYNLGVCLARTSRGHDATEEALAETQAALALAPDLVEARINASGLLLQLGRAPEAETQAEAALALDPHLVPARRNLAEALFRQDRFGEAAAMFGALAGERPDDPEVRSPQVVALLRAGDLEAARAAAVQARQAFPDLAWFDFCLARVEIRSGNRLEALSLLRESLDKDPATRDWMQRVDDFASLSGEPAFETLRRPSRAAP